VGIEIDCPERSAIRIEIPKIDEMPHELIQGIQNALNCVSDDKDGRRVGQLGGAPILTHQVCKKETHDETRDKKWAVHQPRSWQISKRVDLNEECAAHCATTKHQRQVKDQKEGI
jgi:hypothetical protein